jgi:dTDP-glucose 4,6-dehydratase
MIAKAVAGEKLPVYGDGRNRRDWLHVDDHAAGLWQALDRAQPGATYAFGGGAELANLEVVHAVCDHVDRRLGAPVSGPRRNLVEFVPDRPGHDLRYAIDAAKAKAELGWQPRYRFSDGLAATVDWYLGHADWLQSIRAKRYALDRLGKG